MSERNGDKARFGRRRREKLVQRKRSRELRKAMGTEGQKPAAQATPQKPNLPKEDRPAPLQRAAHTPSARTPKGH